MTIGALAVATAAIRASGPILLGGRKLPAPVLQEVVSLLAPALLAALVVVETFSASAGGELEVDERVLGVSAAGIVLARGGSPLPAVAIAATVTAVARALL